MNTKSDTRKFALSKRSTLSGVERADKSRLITQTITTLIQGHKIVAGYYSVRGEVDISPLAEVVRAAGGVWCLPCVENGADLLKFRAWNGEELQEGPFGIRQPGAECEEAQPDLIIVPVVAFDKHCNRIGYGKGYYDRYLVARPKEMLAIGAAFDIQEISQIPVDEWDQALDCVVTETRILNL